MSNMPELFYQDHHTWGVITTFFLPFSTIFFLHFLTPLSLFTLSSSLFILFYCSFSLCTFSPSFITPCSHSIFSLYISSLFFPMPSQSIFFSSLTLLFSTPSLSTLSLWFLSFSHFIFSFYCHSNFHSTFSLYFLTPLSLYFCLFSYQLSLSL